jgi:S1-C subfamily serine protease
MLRLVAEEPSDMGPKPLRSVLRSVVKVLTVADAPDYDQPWQTNGPVGSSGSGAIVDTAAGLRVLTNSHVVENNVFIELRRYGRSRKFVGEVEGLGHECDLALISVDDPAFFDGTEPLPLGKLPSLSDQVSVLGYPIGGDRLSVTQGIVSRVEMSPYAQSQRQLLTVQIDAAINAGNSGGPVIKDGALVGVAFQALEEGQNIGYMIASPVVDHFLRDMENGTFDGFPDLGVVTQKLESTAHRRWLGLDHGGGVLVTAVVYQGSAWAVLERGDVLLSVDGVRIASDGTVRFRKGERIDFSQVVSRRHVDETIEVEVFRNGQPLRCIVKLRPPQYLVPEDRFDMKPTYYLFGGVLFVPLSRDYLKTWGSDWWTNAPRALVALYESEVRSPDRLEIVVLQKVLADGVNQGYHDLESLVIRRVQGVPIKDLRDLVRIVEGGDEAFVLFEATDGTQVVIERAAAVGRADVIMKRFGVPRDRSEDLR